MGIASTFMQYNPNLSTKLIVVNMPRIKLSCHNYIIPFIIENYATAKFSVLVQNFKDKFCAKINGIFNQ